MTNGTTTIDFDTIVNDAIHAYIKHTGTPGMSAAVVYSGQTISPFVYGYIDTAKSAAVTASTVFGMGSVTKLFTSLLLQILVNGNQMGLDDAVTDFLPPDVGQKGNGKLASVTLQDLATHTAGMPNEAPGHPAVQLFGDQAPSQQLMSWWENFEPEDAIGGCWNYSNIGFVTLGFAVAGQPNQIKERLKGWITSPLNMPNTWASGGPGVVAQGYKGTRSKNKATTSMPVDMASSAADMKNFLNAAVIPDQTTQIGKAMLGIQTTYFQGNNCSGQKLNFEMGLAWQIYQMTSGSKTYSLFAKNGIGGGFEAWVGVIPNLTGVVLLANKRVVNPQVPYMIEPTGRKILQAILDATNNL